MNFRVGDPVVCVDATRCPLLKEGEVYIVAGVGHAWAFDKNGSSNGIWLVGVHDGDPECPYWASRFRPAVSPKSEISFTQGAPLDSEQWDNRRLPARVKELGASA